MKSYEGFRSKICVYTSCLTGAEEKGTLRYVDPNSLRNCYAHVLRNYRDVFLVRKMHTKIGTTFLKKYVLETLCFLQEIFI